VTSQALEVLRSNVGLSMLRGGGDLSILGSEEASRSKGV